MLDLLIVGAGVTGCATARWLSQYALSIAVVDAQNDIAMGASRANSAIVHAGYDCRPGSNMAKMNVRGNELFTQWCQDLSVPLGRCGSLVLAFSEADMEELTHLHTQGIANGVPDLRILTRAQTHAMQPHLNPDVCGALYAPTGGITCPYELAQSCARSACENGVTFHRNWSVASIAPIDGGLAVTSAGGEIFHARYVINAAGLHADEIARMVGDASFTINPRKGEYLLLDRSCGADVHTILFQTPNAMGKGVLVAPTVDGNFFAGPTAVNQTSKEDVSVSQKGIDDLRKHARRTMPFFPFQHTITAFSGLRAVADTGDFVLGPSAVQPRLLMAAGICSPGLTSAPAIAEHLEECLKATDLPLFKKAGWRNTLPPHRSFRTMDDEQRDAAIKQDKGHAHIICRCEMVTQAEIVHAIRIQPGAVDLDGIKRRTRAGMGRCQSGFCSPRVLAILAEELKIPPENITKFGHGSRMVLGKLREEGTQ